jgi:Amt family ammonium transporter
MLTWMKRLLAGSAMALAIGATSVMVASPAFADEAMPAAAGPELKP